MKKTLLTLSVVLSAVVASNAMADVSGVQQGTPAVNFCDSVPAAIACDNGKLAVELMTCIPGSVTVWSENGPNQGWTVTFYNGSPCEEGDVISWDSALCVVKAGASGDYPYVITSNVPAKCDLGKGILKILTPQ